jgi:acyl CoA:acetate/3-ketoacid CoA transferase beta subunit
MGSRGPTYPLTAQRCVDLIVTNLAVIKVTDEGLALQEVAPGVEADEVQATTAARLIMGRSEGDGPLAVMAAAS